MKNKKSQDETLSQFIMKPSLKHTKDCITHLFYNCIVWLQQYCQIQEIKLQWNPLNGIPVNRFIRLMGSFFLQISMACLQLILKWVSVNGIIRLMGSVCLGPKVIPLSGAHCSICLTFLYQSDKVDVTICGDDDVLENRWPTPKVLVDQ